jgi:hypothetical protein
MLLTGRWTSKYSEKFKVQGSRFKVKVKSRGRHELFIRYGWATIPGRNDRCHGQLIDYPCDLAKYFPPSKLSA